MALYARFDDIGRPASLTATADDDRIELPPEADDGSWSVDWLAARRCTDLGRVADAAAWVMRDPDPAPPPDDDTAIETPEAPPTLTPPQFEWLLAYTGLDDVWDGLEAATKGVSPETYADLRAARRRGAYEWAETMRLIDVFRPHLPAGSPPLTEAMLLPVWMLAATK